MQGSQGQILIHSDGSSLGNFQKWIGKRGHEIIRVPRTWRVSHGIWVRPDQDSCARKQERQNAVHRTIEGKNSSGGWSLLDPSSDLMERQHQRILHQLCPSTPIYARENHGIQFIHILRDLSILRKGAKILRNYVIRNCYPNQCTSYYSPWSPTNCSTNPDHRWSNDNKRKASMRTDQSRSSRYSGSKPYNIGRTGRKQARQNPSNSPDIILWRPYPILAEIIP